MEGNVLTLEYKLALGHTNLINTENYIFKEATKRMYLSVSGAFFAFLMFASFNFCCRHYIPMKMKSTKVQNPRRNLADILIYLD